VYTDYVDGEERCRVVARKLIYWVAAICVTGGTLDATGTADVMRAKAMTRSFVSKPAQPAPKPEQVLASGVVEQAVEATDIVAAPSAPAPAIAAPAAPAPVIAAPSAVRPIAVLPAPVLPAPVMPTPVVPAPVGTDPVVSAVPVPAADEPSEAAASIDPTPASPFRLANADPHFEAALTALAMRPSGEIPTEEEEIPTAPFEGKGKPNAAVPLPAPRKPVETAKPADMTPSIVLPQVTDVLPRPRPPLTPAQELGLEGKERAKAEKCLATAIYFEARNEPIRGQIAVAQVVLNRVFSPYYPGDVCSVVYQNAHRRLACQFTFACDGIPDIVRERGPWIRAQRIAKQALDSQVWLTDVAKSTHYHATYVRPRWIREMRKMVKHGQHIFYRPHRWGNGEDEAGWGVASLTHSSTHKSKTFRN
jgi:spore germination cell wall hydrolase CwlJ-like protein